MFKYHTVFSYLAVISLSLFLHGCSFSYSSESSSKSSGGSSDSASSIVSSPSNSSKTTEKYQQEIQDYTHAYVKSSDADYASFQKGLTDIAASHGVVDWEQDSITYVAIGRGLKKAGLKGVAYETYKKNLSGSDVTKMADIQEGYDSE
ncbi:MAG: putative lipoprotein [Methylococcales bacterium]|nr:putative lipoprotein [Methylococcales bacterium]